MLYRKYGTTGREVSALGFGAMRFEDPDDIEGSARTVYHAFERGITYFDTAPGYFKGKSEEAVGLAVREMKKSGKDFSISTKSMKPDGAELRRELEDSLRRLEVDAVDFYHCWYVLSMEDWARRKSRGAVEEILRAQEEGLIRHTAFSTHLPGPDIRRVIEEGYFEGVTLGYSVINFPYREEGLAAAAEHDLGAVVMNPLGGGTIVQNPDIFSFVTRRSEQSVLDGALHFLLGHEAVTVALVGFRNIADVDEAVASVSRYEPYSSRDMEELKSRVTEEFNALCTTCRYCDVCPEGIDVWKFVETANHALLEGSEKLSMRLKMHWGTSLEELERCVECRKCEEACTQHLPILERFDLLRERVAGEAEK
jgi:hypothetical protein